MAVFQILPPIGSITKPGMRVLGIYIGTVVLWALVDLIWPSLLAMILVCFTGVISFDEFISSGFGNQTVIFVFLICIFAYFVTASGVSEFIARFMVSGKISAGKPWVISVLYIMASYVIAMLISSVAATIVVLDLFAEFVQRMGYKRRDSYPTLMMVCIVFAAHMGGSVWTFRTPDAILVGYIRAQGGNVPLVPYFLCSVLIGVGALLLYLLICKYVLRISPDRVKQSAQIVETVRLTGYQKRILGCTVILLVLLILENMCGKDTAVGSLLGILGTNGIVVTILAGMMFFRRKEGGAFADIEEATRQIPWKIIYLIIFNMPMAEILNDEALGISESITTLMSGIFGENPNDLLFILILTVMLVVFTTFIGNVPVCLMFYNLVAPYAPALGISTSVLACIISLTSNASVILPGANPQAAMLHGRRDWVETKDVAKYAVIQSFTVVVTVLTVYVLFLRKVL